MIASQPTAAGDAATQRKDDFMASSAEIALMKRRRDAAKSALRFFKDKKNVKSTNNPFARTTGADQVRLDHNRDNSPNTISQAFEDSARTGLGNCDEKGRMCYAALASNPMILGNGIVTFTVEATYRRCRCLRRQCKTLATSGENEVDQHPAAE